MTELEGAILGVVRRSPAGATAYAVRHTFQLSRSAEWSGSAGAVYPALKRLEAQKLVTAESAKDRRGTRTFRLTAKGRAAHDVWLNDVIRAIGPGVDPFRTRADSWPLLQPAVRRRLMRALEQEIVKLRESLSQGPPDEPGTDLYLMLLELRLAWLARQET
jgi:DNA-binding PadR family transcriptional regulator